MDNVKFSVASWALVLSQLQNIPISTILRNWHEVAFSSSFSHDVLPRRFPLPRGFFKLDESVINKPGPAGTKGVIH